MGPAEIGRTGARFGVPQARHAPESGPGSRHRHAPESGPGPQHRHVPESAPESQYWHAPEPTAGEPGGERSGGADLQGLAGAGRPAIAGVRPYVLTGGRTRVRMELRLESLVSATAGSGVTRTDTAERAAVLEVCVWPRAVSEVAALVAVPLGVARVLIDDLVTEGRLTVHGVSSAEDGPSVALMDRVLSGLRTL